jgi:hypothetical protein
LGYNDERTLGQRQGTPRKLWQPQIANHSVIEATFTQLHQVRGGVETEHHHILCQWTPCENTRMGCGATSAQQEDASYPKSLDNWSAVHLQQPDEDTKL